MRPHRLSVCNHAFAFGYSLATVTVYQRSRIFERRQSDNSGQKTDIAARNISHLPILTPSPADFSPAQGPVNKALYDRPGRDGGSAPENKPGASILSVGYGRGIEEFFNNLFCLRKVFVSYIVPDPFKH